jgi:hypothetical protein
MVVGIGIGTPVWINIGRRVFASTITTIAINAIKPARPTPRFSPVRVPYLIKPRPIAIATATATATALVLVFAFATVVVAMAIAIAIGVALVLPTAAAAAAGCSVEGAGARSRGGGCVHTGCWSLVALTTVIP